MYAILVLLWSIDNIISLVADFDFDISESGFDTIYRRFNEQVCNEDIE
jgi:hypothetical protein